jgi:hypothetical protein
MYTIRKPKFQDSYYNTMQIYFCFMQISAIKSLFTRSVVVLRLSIFQMFNAFLFIDEYFFFLILFFLLQKYTTNLEMSQSKVLRIKPFLNLKIYNVICIIYKYIKISAHIDDDW